MLRILRVGCSHITNIICEYDSHDFSEPGLARSVVKVMVTQGSRAWKTDCNDLALPESLGLGLKRNKCGNRVFDGLASGQVLM